MKPPLRCLLAAAPLLSLPTARAGGFLAGLKQIIPKGGGDIPIGVPKINIEEVMIPADGALQVAQKIGVPDMAQKIGVPGLKHSVPSKELISDITGGSIEGRVKDVAGSVKDAASSLKGSAEQVAEKMPKAVGALQIATPDRVASALREAAPRVASVVNRTSLRVADEVLAQSPKLAAAMNRAGHRMADRLDGGKRDGGARPRSAEMAGWLPPSGGVFADSPEVRKASDWGLAALVIFALLAAAGFAELQRQKSTERRMPERGPALLSEVLEKEGAIPCGSPPPRWSSAREPAIQAEAQMSLFQKF